MLPQDTIPEEWRSVVGWEGLYSVSSLGRVRRDKPGPGARVGRILKAVIGRYGYYQVALSRDCRPITQRVHLLVAAAFLGPCPPGHVANHLDGVKLHNQPSNLEYCTPSENMAHARRLGLFAAGDGHYARLHPEWMARGERHGRATKPERTARGDRHGSRTQPEKWRHRSTPHENASESPPHRSVELPTLG